MMKKKKSFFNLVEVALAIAVAGIGIAGIMALFPVGMNASRDAMAENYCGDSAEQLMSYISAYCKSNWNTTIWNSGADPTGALALATEKKYNYLPPPASPPYTEAEDSTITWCPDANAIEGSIYFVNNAGNPANLQLFKIVRKSGDYEDFAAAVRLWKGPIKNINFRWISSVPSLSYAYGTALYAEVSWPMSKPYSKRDKKYFYKEIFNPNPNP